MNKEEEKLYKHEWYKRNKASVLVRTAARSKRVYEEYREFVKSLKTACISCGEADSACLDFHHRVPEDKVLPIAIAITRGWSKARLLAEINKCDVICANCHRKQHYYG
jgi:hypothetical protein